MYAKIVYCFFKFCFFFFSENYKHTRRKDGLNLRNNIDINSSLNSQSAQTVVNSLPVNKSLKSSSFSSSSSPSFQSSKSSQHHHRQKRSTSYKRNVEVMVAADNKMLKYHGNDLERYILTLMSIVSMAKKFCNVVWKQLANIFLVRRVRGLINKSS